jgi:hypothetical protein
MTRPLLVAVLLAMAACQPSASESPSPSASASAAPSALESASAEPSAPGSGESSSSVDCSTGSLDPDLFVTLTGSAPTDQRGQGYCIVEWILFFPGAAAAGPAVVTVGGSPVLSVDMSSYDSFGSEGAGSGERYLAVSSPIGVEPNTTVSLDLSGCSGCDALQVQFGAASR